MSLTYGKIKRVITLSSALLPGNRKGQETSGAAQDKLRSKESVNKRLYALYDNKQPADSLENNT